MTHSSAPPRTLANAQALLRPRIALLAAFGAAAGAVLTQSPPGMRGLAEPSGGLRGLPVALAFLGALLLAGGVSALNQVQERGADSRMARTADRPLPAGRTTPRAALLLSSVCLILAALVLALSPGGALAAACVPLTALIYNGCYTPLKTRTPLALLVGAIAGALPPIVGCVAAGGDPFGPSDPRALLLAGVFYAWQVPHFWLFARIHREEYAAAGFLVPHDAMGRAPALGAPVLWLVCCGALMLLPPALGLMTQTWPKALVAALACGLCLCARPLMARARLGFAVVNGALALFLCFLAADALRLAS